MIVFMLGALVGGLVGHLVPGDASYLLAALAGVLVGLVGVMLFGDS